MTYLSPSSLTKFYEDQDKFFIEYLADFKWPRDPQTPAMAVGSSFDAFVKSHLHEQLFGKAHDPRFELQTLFEAQVEAHGRDAAWKAGENVFREYKKSGALTDLMVELTASVTTPRFEFDLLGQIQSRDITLGAVPLLGKPDLFYTNSRGARVIHDWKVNGYYSKYNVSPAKGYVRLRELGFNKGPHKDALPMVINGVLINAGITLDMVKEDWAQQLAIYMWLCGEEVGSQECFASIDQVVCSNSSVRIEKDLRFAEHRSRISKDFQYKVFNKAKEAWSIINSDHFFRGLSKEVSQEKCRTLNTLREDIQNRPQTSNDDWHGEVTKKRIF